LTDTFHLLSDGLLRLCRNDPDVDRLITPRYDEIFSLLVKYITEIELYNPALSLVGTSDRDTLIVRHILDSLAPLSQLVKHMSQFEHVSQFKHMSQFDDKTLKIADVGSGAGLPGIPLAIVMPHIEFVLIERMGRRAGFLRNTLTGLGLSNVSVEEAEMEKTQRGRFALVTFRAFRPLEPKMFKTLFRLCGEGGTLAAYKGRREKIEAEVAALETALPNIAGCWEIIPCPVPFLDEERHLLIIRN
jgi:16S rRNA (guanine527-N7)-methyltransferase